ncbi:MAG TPA: NfeD family protein [Acidimicrobiales bacterium]|nr:NfeD family protein [Acidimicrobiales bacterium]
MWAVAGVLLGMFFLTSLLGFHLGPHSHAVATVLGVLGAAWLIATAVSGESSALLWTLFSADVCLTVGVGLLAWRGLHFDASVSLGHHYHVMGKQGVAKSALTPDGTVNLMGEDWSATSLNGDVKAGAVVQVIGREGLRLEVWGEDNEALNKGESK